ncbi:MAG: hypothetical protein J6S68_14440 [Acinetobacter sp.]|nr:hypothetical protein [Acinetobacter sp.]
MIIRTEHNGGLKGFLERFREIGKPKVYIGVPASKNGMHEGGINMATLLALHVLGAPSRGIPQRDPLRPPLIANAHRYSDLLAIGLKNALANGTDPKLVYEKIGIVATNDVKDYFITGNFKALSEKTIKAKGSSKPLIDTGELRNSISYEVRNK